MAREEKLLTSEQPTVEAVFDLVRENHRLRETSVLLRGVIVALREKLAAERRRKNK